VEKFQASENLHQKSQFAISFCSPPVQVVQPASSTLIDEHKRSPIGIFWFKMVVISAADVQNTADFVIKPEASAPPVDTSKWP